MILVALNRAGGEDYLLEQARANPSAFLSLVAKVLPMQVNGSANVLLIEQLCVVANNEWQKERAALTQRTIEGESAEIDETGKPAKAQVH